jgi:hypothetical protein
LSNSEDMESIFEPVVQKILRLVSDVVDAAVKGQPESEISVGDGRSLHDFRDNSDLSKGYRPCGRFWGVSVSD